MSITGQDGSPPTVHEGGRWDFLYRLNMPRPFWKVLSVYAIWYFAGLILSATSWLPAILRKMSVGWGDSVFLVLASILTVINARRDFSPSSVIGATLWIILIAGIAETLGVMTGFPFGRYVYTDQMGWKLLGIIPWIIPACWLILVFNAYIICCVLIIPRHLPLRDGNHLLILVTAFVVTLVDFNLEPVAVNVKQYWIWLERDHVYYGVPRLNFFGWFVISMILAGVMSQVLDPRRWRWSTACVSWTILGSIQLFFAVLNWQAGQLIPVVITLNLMGLLAIGLVFLWDSKSSP